MIDDHLNPWLIEANSNASMSIDHEGADKKK